MTSHFISLVLLATTEEWRGEVKMTFLYGFIKKKQQFIIIILDFFTSRMEDQAILSKISWDQFINIHGKIKVEGQFKYLKLELWSLQKGEISKAGLWSIEKQTAA